MSARADDPMWWAPLGSTIWTSGPQVVHFCPAGFVTTLTTRSQLDPMALGTCRYCGEPLPVPHESDRS